MKHRPTQTAILIKYGYKGCTRIFPKNVGTTSKFSDARRATRGMLHMDSL
jgi:hypothetical protein